MNYTRFKLPELAWPMPSALGHKSVGTYRSIERNGSIGLRN
jgi:hypothetical protein